MLWGQVSKMPRMKQTIHSSSHQGDGVNVPIYRPVPNRCTFKGTETYSLKLAE